MHSSAPGSGDGPDVVVRDSLAQACTDLLALLPCAPDPIHHTGPDADMDGW
jgi:hypothetical protein